METYIDLHTHSTASDGTDTPEELVVKAKEAGLRAFALTDHDNFNGIERAQKKADEIDIELIKGIELSCAHTIDEVHILGYWLNKDDEHEIKSEALQKVATHLKNLRNERNETLFKKLKSVGITLNYDDLYEVMKLTSQIRAEDDLNPIICRPHYALAMVKKGYVPDTKTAFAKYLGSSGSAYVEKEKLSQSNAIEILRNAKALVVLAHPFLIGVRNAKERKALIKQLKNYGLQGIEAHYSTNNKDQTNQTLLYAKEYDLAITGGSDYHGNVKPHIAIGKGQGKLQIPYSVLEKMREYKSSIE